ncbi:Uncharacterised protein [uncultured archaeon]|nr:Uncharacterised protein [uncultured archaeon]
MKSFEWPVRDKQDLERVLSAVLNAAKEKFGPKLNQSSIMGDKITMIYSELGGGAYLSVAYDAAAQRATVKCVDTPPGMFESIKAEIEKA